MPFQSYDLRFHFIRLLLSRDTRNKASFKSCCLAVVRTEKGVALADGIKEDPYCPFPSMSLNGLWISSSEQWGTQLSVVHSLTTCCFQEMWVPPREWPFFSHFLAVPTLHGRREKRGKKGPMCSWWARFFFSVQCNFLIRRGTFPSNISKMIRCLCRISKLSIKISGQHGCCLHQVYSLVMETDTKQVIIIKRMDTSKYSTSCSGNKQGDLRMDWSEKCHLEEVTIYTENWMNRRQLGIGIKEEPFWQREMHVHRPRQERTCCEIFSTIFGGKLIKANMQKAPTRVRQDANILHTLSHGILLRSYDVCFYEERVLFVPAVPHCIHNTLGSIWVSSRHSIFIE